MKSPTSAFVLLAYNIQRKTNKNNLNFGRSNGLPLLKPNCNRINQGQSETRRRI